MENDLISRSALKETMFQNEPVEQFHPVENREWREHFQFIEDAHAVDTVPVVRCGECAHRVYKEINDCEIGGCELFGVALPCDFYCAEGERRADDGK